MSVLIVDDNLEIRQLLSLLSKKQGYTPISYANTAEVLKDNSILNSDIKLAILDITMPGESGVSLAWTLQEKIPDTPIMVFSGNLSNWEISDIKDCGVDCIVEKPCKVEIMQQLINYLITTGKGSDCKKCLYYGNTCRKDLGYLRC